MKKCGTKKEFIAKLKKKGYDVRWEQRQKTMTYTCPNGMKVRDNKLHDARFMKEAMEHEFRIREQYLEQIARFAEANCGGNAGDTLQADSLCDTQGALGADAFTAWAADRVSGKTVSSNAANANSTGNDQLHTHGGEKLGGYYNQADLGDRSAASTGWEESRRVYFETVISAVRGQTRAAQNYKYTEHADKDFLGSDDITIGSAVGTGLAAVISLADMSESDDPEEVRKRIEAQLAGQNLGFLIGIVLALVEKAKEESSQKREPEHEIDEQRPEEETETEDMQMTF